MPDLLSDYREIATHTDPFLAVRLINQTKVTNDVYDFRVAVVVKVPFLSSHNLSEWVGGEFKVFSPAGKTISQQNIRMAKGWFSNEFATEFNVRVDLSKVGADNVLFQAIAYLDGAAILATSPLFAVREPLVLYKEPTLLDNVLGRDPNGQDAGLASTFKWVLVSGVALMAFWSLSPVLRAASRSAAQVIDTKRVVREAVQ